MKTDPKCCECGLPCDAMCPTCFKPVHQAYGQWYQANCGNEHKEVCIVTEEEQDNG